MTAVSAALACCPDANVLTRVAMFSAIWVRTGRSCKARLIHCALHPVVAIEIASTRARMVFDLECFMVFSGKAVVSRSSWVVGRVQLAISFHCHSERRERLANARHSRSRKTAVGLQ